MSVMPAWVMWQERQGHTHVHNEERRKRRRDSTRRRHPLHGRLRLARALSAHMSLSPHEGLRLSSQGLNKRECTEAFQCCARVRWQSMHACAGNRVSWEEAGVWENKCRLGWALEFEYCKIWRRRAERKTWLSECGCVGRCLCFVCGCMCVSLYGWH